MEQAESLLNGLIQSFVATNSGQKMKKLANQRKMKAIMSSIQSLFDTQNIDDEIAMDVIELITDFAQIMFRVSPESYDEAVLYNKPSSRLTCIPDNEYSCNYIIELINKECQWVFDPAISEFYGIADYIYFGIKPLNETHPVRDNKTRSYISLVVDSITNDFEPSDTGSVRYSCCGEIWTGPAPMKPVYLEHMDAMVPQSVPDKVVASYDINDIITVKVGLKDKTIEFFKNGDNVYNGIIKFDFPWYFGVWPICECKKFKINIIHNQDQLI